MLTDERNIKREAAPGVLVEFRRWTWNPLKLWNTRL